MFSNYEAKLFYCHTCKKSSMINLVNLVCPICSSDFLEEANMRETGLIPNLPDPNFSADLDESPPEPSDLSESFEENEPRPESLISVLIRQISNDLFQHPRLSRFESNRENRENRGENLRENPFLRYFELIRNERNNLFSQPVRVEDLDSITTKKIAEEDLENECQICGDLFKLEEEAKILECSHSFHTECIVPWLKLKTSCPTCRHRLI